MTAHPPSDAAGAGEVATRRVLVALAAAMVSGGSTVTDVEAEVRRIGAALGHPAVQVSATPTSITLSLAHGEPATVEVVGPPLRLDQSLTVGELRRDLLAGRHQILDTLAALATVRTQQHRYHRIGIYGGNLLVAVGICLIMQPALVNVAFAGACSLLVSFLVRSSGRHALLAALLPTAAAFTTTLAVLAGVQHGMLHGALRTLICPLAVLLPGALLSTGIAELARGAMISGTARFFHGIVQLLLFALGVVAAERLLGLPPGILTNLRVDQLGLVAAPLGLACIALGIMLSEAVPWRVFGWTTLVLVATFTTQMLGQRYGGSPAIGAFLGAAVANFSSTALEMTRRNVPRLITFLPSFWLLVPGTLGLMGITTIGLGTGRADAVISVLGLITSIALGLLVGSAFTLPLRRLARGIHHVHLMPRR